MEDLDGVELISFIEQVLPHRDSQHHHRLCEKFEAEGVAQLSDLGRVSEELFKTKLATHANFNFIEMTDAISLRSAIAPLSAKDARPTQNGRKGGTRSPPWERSRSRSPRRGGGQRNNKRPHRGRKSGNDSNKEEKVKPELWAAVAQGDAAKVQDLLAQGKDPAETFEGWSPLMKASEEGAEEVMRMLLDKKVDVEAANKKGRTALSFAAAPSNDGNTPRPTSVAAIRLLLQSGADAERKDVTGVTAKERAAREKRDEAVAVFEEFGV